jgi:hypothetical protein
MTIDHPFRLIEADCDRSCRAVTLLANGIDIDIVLTGGFPGDGKPKQTVQRTDEEHGAP